MVTSNSKIPVNITGFNTTPDQERAGRELGKKLRPMIGDVEFTFNGHVGDRAGVSTSGVLPEQAREFAQVVKSVIGPCKVKLTMTL